MSYSASAAVPTLFISQSPHLTLWSIQPLWLLRHYLFSPALHLLIWVIQPLRLFLHYSLGSHHTLPYNLFSLCSCYGTIYLVRPYTCSYELFSLCSCYGTVYLVRHYTYSFWYGFIQPLRLLPSIYFISHLPSHTIYSAPATVTARIYLICHNT
jgi:hypothetical protein